MRFAYLVKRRGFTNSHALQHYPWSLRKMVEDNLIPFDRARKRRFTKATAGKDEDFVMTSLRIPSRHLRKLDEICALRVEEYLKTKADCINDAINTWLETFLDEHGEELRGMKNLFQLEDVGRIRDARDRDLELIANNLKISSEEGNRPLLSSVLANAMRVITEITNDPYGSPQQKKQAEKLKENAMEALEKMEQA